MTLAVADNLGRATHAYVSGYSRNRVHQSRLYANESALLLADFNGAMAAGRVISSVTWKSNGAGYVNMSDATIQSGKRTSSVVVQCGFAGKTWFRCSATLSTGQILTQMFIVTVEPAPWMSGDSFTYNGVQSLTSP